MTRFGLPSDLPARAALVLGAAFCGFAMGVLSVGAIVGVLRVLGLELG